MIYRFFYKVFFQHLPERLIERFGGTYFSISSKLIMKKPEKIPFQIKNIDFNYPVGMPAGWIDTPNKPKVVRNLGVGIGIIKTITAKEKLGNPYPRIIRMGDTLINSMGLPNKGVKWWSDNYQPLSDYPSIISIKGSSFNEWSNLIDILETKTDIFELNFSCPNVSDGIMDLHKSIDLIKEISGISNVPIFVKLSPEYSIAQNLEFVNKIRSHIHGISALNTVPTFHSKLGNPQKIGGISCRSIHHKLLAILSAIRQSYPSFRDLPIFASGGIMTPMEAWDVLSIYKSLPLSLTGFLIKGPKFYFKIIDFFQNQMKKNEVSLNSLLN